MRIAVPNKGRLHQPTIDLLERAGLHLVNGADRKLYVDTVDPDVTVLFARAADIPEYVADGAAAVGITGLDQAHESGTDLVLDQTHESGGDLVLDQTHESGADLVDLLDLGYGRCRLVLAAPEESEIERSEDLAGGTVATEFPKIARNYFDGMGINPTIAEVSGATELTPHVDIADAIIDITSTGTTLRMNRLTIVDEVMESSVRLFARPDTANDPKVTQIVTAIQSVLAADGKRYLMMNVPEENLEAVKNVIPGMGGPTVMDVAGQDALAVHVVVDESDVFETISKLREQGASDILVTEIERLVE
jgi:ATP phosphoribosyltransferase